MSLAIIWLSVFADVPAARLAPACRFWAAITGTTAGAPKGRNGEFTPLLTPNGDGFLWLQRVGRDDGGWHPDLHVRDVAGARQLAIDCGAKVVSDAADLVALQTPAGQPFCLVGDDRPQRQRPPTPVWPSGRSLADQLCLDIPAAGYEDDTQFWSALTGWPSSSTDLPEFRRINPPGALPVQFLLQRLGDDDTAGTRAHLDMSADDRAAEVTRHEALGASIVNVTDGWTTLTDPVGLTYCVTGRRPGMPAR